MTAWFDDMPLDWTRDETRAAERIVLTVYDSNFAALALAQNVGLNTAGLNQMAPLRFLVREMLEKARLSDRLLTLIAEVFADPAATGLHEELNRLVAGHEAAVRHAGVNRKPSLATLAALPPTFDIWGPAADDSPVRSAQGNLERTINAMAGFVEPANFRKKLAAAEVRTARVEIRGKPTGTGFLVGTDMLMTNWHVVEGGIDGALARFDHSSSSDGRVVRFAQDWLVAHSPHDSTDNELGPDGPADGTWDFAVVRLAEPVGDEPFGTNLIDVEAERRGYFVPDWGPYEFDCREPLLILGHPEGRPIQLSYASPARARFTSARNRIRYDTNTEPGSSGSPVFNRDFRIVALHHSGNTGTTALFNQGVPIAGIGEALRTALVGSPELALLGLS